MIDVQRLQRLNQLASDLLEHGFAQDREDAMRQADDTLKKESSHEVSILRMGSAPPLDDQKTSSVASGQGSPARAAQDTPSHVYTPDWNTLYRSLSKKIEEQNGQIQTLATQIRQLGIEITSLKNTALPATPKIQRSFSDATAAMPADQPARASADVIDANTGKAVPMPDGRQGSPRTGGYSPKDVAVEKIFYSGTRPQK